MDIPKIPKINENDTQNNFSESNMNVRRDLQSKSKGNFVKKNFFQIITVVLLVAVLGGLAYIWQIVENPPYLEDLQFTNTLVEEISEQTSVNTLEQPVISQIRDAEQLRNSNIATNRVYADAQEGDYVILYSDKMIIYRRPTQSIIYEGETPQQIISQSQNEFTQRVLGIAKTNEIISEDYSGIPQLSGVTEQNIEALKEQNGEFFELAQTGDVIALFQNEQKIMLIRPNTNSNGDLEVINTGNFQSTIETIGNLNNTEIEETDSVQE
jgi:hypothetical protein